jgi:hypothetical protein
LSQADTSAAVSLDSIKDLVQIWPLRHPLQLAHQVLLQGLSSLGSSFLEDRVNVVR